MYLYEIGLKDPQPIHATKEWRRNSRHYCRVCESVNVSRFPEPIDIAIKHKPEGRFYSWVWFTGISIYHVDFINQLRPFLDGFSIGRCFDENGNLIDDYVTCYTSKNIFVRGSRDNVYICDQCGTIKGSRSEPYYIFNYYLYDSQIFHNSVTRMYLSEKIVNVIDFSQWTDIDLEKIPILDEPQDGVHLPCDLPHIIERYPACSNMSALSQELVDKIKKDYYNRDWKSFKGCD